MNDRTTPPPTPPPVRHHPRRVEKPWGYEVIWAETEHYLGKILHVHAGEILSLQYHEEKDETLYVLHGEVRVEVGSKGGASAEAAPIRAELRLRAGEGIRVPPRTVHRIAALSDADLLEASTSHIEDVVRLVDRYGRAPE